jgi:hypothetical protein
MQTRVPAVKIVMQENVDNFDMDADWTFRQSERTNEKKEEKAYFDRDGMDIVFWNHTP